MRHWSDCATNNRGTPELLGPCDCGGYSDTPRTDALIDSLCPYLDGKITDTLEAHAKQLERENAKLLMALKRISAINGCDTHWEITDARGIADAAIAKAEGK